MIAEQEDRYLIDLKPFSVSRCYVDYSFGIQVLEKDLELDIRIGGNFVFSHRGVKIDCDPSVKSTLCPALEIFNLKFEQVSAFKEGSLEICFEDQKQIFVPVDQSYESWEISASNGLLIVSQPSGGLAIWYPHEI